MSFLNQVRARGTHATQVNNVKGKQHGNNEYISKSARLHSVAGIGVRDGGSGGGGQLTPQFGQIYDIYSGRYMTFIRAKDNTFV